MFLFLWRRKHAPHCLFLPVPIKGCGQCIRQWITENCCFMVDVISSMKVMRRGLKNSKSLVLYPWCMAVIVSVYHMEVGIMCVLVKINQGLCSFNCRARNVCLLPPWREFDFYLGCPSTPHLLHIRERKTNQTL